MQNEINILNYLKTMKFKRSLFGLNRSDVLEKIRTLNLMYREMQEQQENEANESAQYEKKIEALTRAFVDMQEKAEGIVGQAKMQADEITETAKRDAETIMEQVRLNTRNMIAAQQLELEQLSEKKNTMLLELKHIYDTLNQFMKQDSDGEIGDISK